MLVMIFMDKIISKNFHKKKLIKQSSNINKKARQLKLL